MQIQKVGGLRTHILANSQLSSPRHAPQLSTKNLDEVSGIIWRNFRKALLPGPHGDF